MAVGVPRVPQTLPATSTQAGPVALQAQPWGVSGRRDSGPKQGLAFCSPLRPLLTVIATPDLLAQAHSISEEGREWSVSLLLRGEGLQLTTCLS